MPEVGMLIRFGHERFYNRLYINTLENKPCPRLVVSDKAPAVTNHYQPQMSQSPTILSIIPDLPQKMLLFVSSDDLKQDLPRKMLLFVSSDDLKQDLPQKMLLFVSSDDLKQDLP